ncbi:MAG: ASCH domain-containing protein [Bacteroidota bacterium]
MQRRYDLLEEKYQRNTPVKVRPVLHLNLKRKWFDMVAAGEKKEEYREVKPFWNRVFDAYITIRGRRYHPSDVDIMFSNGYAKNRRQMLVECKYMKIGAGRTDWGAEAGEQYHTLVLGEIKSKNL